MKTFFGYIRVSTAKQGEQGVSLQEQRDAIERYAQRNGLQIREWFEERETAAKRGRAVFARMLALLKQGRANGIIVHKIDRSARNLKDWADLGDLIDRGVEVHFANESLDLNTRGGRLSADIQAVVAADYIRNLREETKKGFYGRIKQGLYPLPAPLGYLDKGKGKAKEPDLVNGPLVRKAFELYGTGRHNLESLRAEMDRLGLRSRFGGRSLSRTGLATALHNPFYIGLIRLRRTSETFPGVHQPLISKSLFDRVQAILSGKVNTRSIKHQYLFRRLLTCRPCGRSLIGEAQKGHIYYRCHTPTCLTKCVREELVERTFLQQFSACRLSEKDRAYLCEKIEDLKLSWGEQRGPHIAAITLNLGQINTRLRRLTDAFIDGTLDKDLFEDRKTALLMERKVLEEKLQELRSTTHSVPDRIADFLELAGSLYSSYESALRDEKRDLLKVATSNRWVDGKNVDVMLELPFQEVANRANFSYGAPARGDLLRRYLSRLTQQPPQDSFWQAFSH